MRAHGSVGRAFPRPGRLDLSRKARCRRDETAARHMSISFVRGMSSLRAGGRTPAARLDVPNIVSYSILTKKLYGPERCARVVFQ